MCGINRPAAGRWLSHSAPTSIGLIIKITYFKPFTISVQWRSQMTFPRNIIEAAHTLRSDAWVVFLDPTPSIVSQQRHPLDPPSVSLQTAQSHCPRCLEFLVGAVTWALPLSTLSSLRHHVTPIGRPLAVSVVQLALKRSTVAPTRPGPGVTLAPRMRKLTAPVCLHNALQGSSVAPEPASSLVQTSFICFRSIAFASSNMYFTASTVAILALAAGSQAAVPKKGEPPVLNHKSVVQSSAVSTGSHPIMTGISGGNSTGGSNSTVTTTPSVPVFPSSTESAGAPGATPSAGSSSGAGSSSSGSSSSGSSGAAGAGSSSGASSGASPSSSPGFTPSNPGAKVAVPMAGVLGSVAYGLLLV
ncbi:hypothetical protein N7510_001732 [Penicillium lagena]|uniref:uncharacterized protein n=1 Tax=Penicillium lagena TaxID=94218 RepID=UPI0025406EAC|nr:uncharacterized protein N7510_001732 [Penicillium lagena]KAJ5625423.1 hypothetical protein N7510_001732 [Penicillium lagena]